MRTLLKALVCAGLSICAVSCASRVIVIDSAADVVRLGRGVKGPVYTQNPDGTWTLRGKVKLPEGWYAGPMK